MYAGEADSGDVNTVAALDACLVAATAATGAALRADAQPLSAPVASAAAATDCPAALQQLCSDLAASAAGCSEAALPVLRAQLLRACTLLFARCRSQAGAASHMDPVDALLGSNNAHLALQSTVAAVLQPHIDAHGAAAHSNASTAAAAVGEGRQHSAEDSRHAARIDGEYLLRCPSFDGTALPACTSGAQQSRSCIRASTAPAASAAAPICEGSEWDDWGSPSAPAQQHGSPRAVSAAQGPQEDDWGASSGDDWAPAPAPAQQPDSANTGVRPKPSTAAHGPSAGITGAALGAPSGGAPAHSRKMAGATQVGPQGECAGGRTGAAVAAPAVTPEAAPVATDPTGSPDAGQPAKPRAKKVVKRIVKRKVKRSELASAPGGVSSAASADSNAATVSVGAPASSASGLGAAHTAGLSAPAASPASPAANALRSTASSRPDANAVPAASSALREASNAAEACCVAEQAGEASATPTPDSHAGELQPADRFGLGTQDCEGSTTSSHQQIGAPASAGTSAMPAYDDVRGTQAPVSLADSAADGSSWGAIDQSVTDAASEVAPPGALHAADLARVATADSDALALSADPEGTQGAVETEAIGRGSAAGAASAATCAPMDSPHSQAAPGAAGATSPTGAGDPHAAVSAAGAGNAARPGQEAAAATAHAFATPPAATTAQAECAAASSVAAQHVSGSASAAARELDNWPAAWRSDVRGSDAPHAGAGADADAADAKRHPPGGADGEVPDATAATLNPQLGAQDWEADWSDHASSVGSAPGTAQVLPAPSALGSAQLLPAPHAIAPDASAKPAALSHAGGERSRSGALPEWDAAWSENGSDLQDDWGGSWDAAPGASQDAIADNAGVAPGSAVQGGHATSPELTEAERAAARIVREAKHMSRSAHCAKAPERSAGAQQSLVAAIARCALEATPPPCQLQQMGGGGVQNVLAQGLGVFGLRSAEAKLSDFDCVVICVVGGVTMHEVYEVAQVCQETRAARALGAHVPDVLVGGTELLCGDNLARELSVAC